MELSDFASHESNINEIEEQIFKAAIIDIWIVN